jgi:hypothetical protein
MAFRDGLLRALDPQERGNRSTLSVENPVEKGRKQKGKPRDSEHFSGLHHRSANVTREPETRLADRRNHHSCVR